MGWGRLGHLTWVTLGREHPGFGAKCGVNAYMETNMTTLCSTCKKQHIKCSIYRYVFHKASKKRSNGSS